MLSSFSSPLNSIPDIPGIISVVIGGHFGGGDHFDGGNHFGGGTALFHVISPFGNLVIAYRTNLVVIVVPKAFRTFHDQRPVHIRVLAMFTGTFGVKGGGRSRATTFCFLTIVFSVVVALLGAFSFNAILRSHFLLLLLLIFNIR